MSTVLSTGRADTKAYFTEGYNRGHDYDMQNTCMLVIARYPIPYNSMTVPTIVRVSGPPWFGHSFDENQRLGFCYQKSITQN